MVVIVVGGSEHGVGKTSLACGLIRALAEIEWTAIKITSHNYGQDARIWEESSAAEGTDTSRYLAAGARRALLVTATDEELEDAVRRVLWQCAARDGAVPICRGGGASNSPTGILLESNRVLGFVEPDLCLGVEGAPGVEQKASYSRVAARADALVRRAACDAVVEGPAGESVGGSRPVFELRNLERLSERMRDWLQERLRRLRTRN